jgi:hypothetical protein
LDSRIRGNDVLFLHLCGLLAKRMVDDDMTETERILSGIEGGPELLQWFNGRVNFGDGEVVELHLTREKDSRLVVDAMKREDDEWSFLRVTFHLKDVADIKLEGWSHQNVIEGLEIWEAPEINWHPSLLGIGISTPDHMIELQPLAGAFGKILATITKVEFKSIPSWYEPAAKA